MTKTPLEAEAKYRIEDAIKVREAIVASGGVFCSKDSHCDTYLRHPSRDFRSTDEALRIREINGKPFITYKGPRLVGPIKIRPETELPLAEGTVDDWLGIWQNLSFAIALQVRKTRESFKLPYRDRNVTITMDEVDSLGNFVEIELVLSNESEALQAQSDIQAIALQLGLHDMERRSYLGMLLENGTKS